MDPTGEPYIVKVHLMGPLPTEALFDEAKWGPDNQATWAVDAGYNEDDLFLDLEKGEDRMKKHAIIFWVRCHELNERRMNAIINQNYPVDSRRNDKRKRDLRDWQLKWQHKLLGSGEKVFFYNVVAYEVTLHDFYANLTNLKRTYLISRHAIPNESAQEAASRVQEGREALSILRETG